MYETFCSCKNAASLEIKFDIGLGCKADHGPHSRSYNREHCFCIIKLLQLHLNDLIYGEMNILWNNCYLSVAHSTSF